MPDLLPQLQQILRDRYTIEREIGHGGMAVVYLAQDRKHQRRVAIKVLRPEFAVAIGPERFLREIEIAARLSHPHILPLYDSGANERLLYYVMPMIEGKSLRDRITEERRGMFLLRLDPEFDSLRGDPRFARLVEKVSAAFRDSPLTLRTDQRRIE